MGQSPCVWNQETGEVLQVVSWGNFESKHGHQDDKNKTESVLCMLRCLMTLLGGLWKEGRRAEGPSHQRDSIPGSRTQAHRARCSSVVALHTHVLL